MVTNIKFTTILLKKQSTGIRLYQHNQIDRIFFTGITVLWESYIDWKNNEQPNQKDDYELIKSYVNENQPVVISLGGHAVLAYKVIEFQDSASVLIYDPNFPDRKDRHIIFVFHDDGKYVAYYLINDITPIPFVHAYYPFIAPGLNIIADIKWTYDI